MGIARGAERVGLASRAVKASKTHLDELPLPAVVHWEGNHWVVLYAVEDGHVRVADPARGRVRVAREEFDEKWSGYAALLAYTPALEDAPLARTDVALAAPVLPAAPQEPRGRVRARVPRRGPPARDPDRHADRRRRRDSGRATAALRQPRRCSGSAAVFVLMLAATLVQRYLLAKVAVRIDASTLDFLTGRLLALPMSYFNTRRTGDIERRLAGMRQVRQLRRPERRARAHRRHAADRGGRADVRLQLDARARLPRDGAALRAADALLVEPPAADVRQPRGGVRALRLAPDRRDQGHRDGQGARRRGRAPPADAGRASRASPTGSSARSS